MLRLLLLCALALVTVNGSAVKEDEISKRIVGGFSGTVDQFPFLVLIMKKDTSARICGGTIVKDDWVLTSAKCVKDQNLENLIIKAGIANIESDANAAQTVAPEAIHIYPSYDPENPFDGDIAMIKLKTKLQINQNTQEVRIANEEVDVVGQAYTGGWGSENPVKEVYKNEMKIARIDVDSAADCQKGLDDLCAQHTELEICKKLQGFKFHERLLCTVHTNKGYETGICTGDFGGPLIKITGYNDFLVGVNSMVIGDCARGISLYSNVPQYSEFINSFLQKREEPQEKPEEKSEDEE